MEKKKKWIGKATENAHGQFKKKAESAGMSTRAYAEKEKGAGGLVGKQANLALNLMHAGGKKKEESKRPTIKGFMKKMHGSSE